MTLPLYITYCIEIEKHTWRTTNIDDFNLPCILPVIINPFLVHYIRYCCVLVRLKVISYINYMILEAIEAIITTINAS